MHILENLKDAKNNNIIFQQRKLVKEIKLNLSKKRKYKIKSRSRKLKTRYK